MSDSETPPPGQDPAPHDHPHGVVETLREELHEVVEHVPQPVRWTLGKLVRVIVLSLIGLVVLAAVSTVLYLANRTELVAHELTLVLNQTLARRSDIVLELKDLKGNPLTGFRAVQPRLLYRDGGGTLLEAADIRVGYSALGLLRGGRGPVSITFDQPVVRLDLGPGGVLRVPRWESRPGTGRARELDFSVHLRGADVRTPRPLGRISGLELDLGGSMGTRTELHVQRMQFERGPWHSRLERLEADLTADADSVRFRVRQLRTGDLRLTGAGGWRTGGPARAVHVDVSNVRWAWLAEVFDNDTFDVPGEGSATVDALGGPRWTGRFRAHLDWDSLFVDGRGLLAWDGRQLALDSLSAQSPAGNLAGGLRWSRLGWELSGQARGANPAHWGALRLDGWPEGSLNGGFRYTVDTRTRNSSRLDARLRASEWTGWNVDSAAVRVEFPASAPDSFVVDGFRRGGLFTLRGRMNEFGWSGPFHIADFPLEEWPDGRASGLRGRLLAGDGRVSSRPAGLFVSGVLAGEATRWSATQFGRWTLAHIEGRLLPKPDLTAELGARDGFFTGVHLDSAAAPIHLLDESIVFGPVQAAAGDTVFHATGNASWSGEQWRTTLTSASATSRQFSWVAEPPLEISGDRFGTRFDRFVANDGDAHLEARGHWAAPGGAYDFVMEGRGLDLSRLGFPEDWGLAGSGNARLAVSGRPGDPSFTFAGGVSQPAFAGHPCDSLAVSLAGSSHRLRVSDFLYRLRGGEVRADGSVDGAVRSWPDSITPTAVVRWLADAGRWQGHLAARAVPLDRLEAFAPGAAGWGGLVTADVTLGGRPARPELDIKASAENLGWREYRAQHLEGRATLREDQLEIPELRVTMQDVVSTLSGSMPLQLALGRPPVIPDAPVRARAQVPRGDLKLLPALVPLVQSARGRFDLDASLAGTTRHPQLTGLAHIREATVRPAGREEALEGVYADLRFDQTRVTLDSLRARQGRTGRVWGRGGMDLNGLDYRHYAFDLHLRDFASSQEALYAMLFDGDFQVVDGPPVRGERLPQVLGSLHCKRAVVEFDFANQTEVQKRMATTEPLYWTYRVHLDAPSNLHWRPQEGDIEFDADLDLEQTADSLLIYGEMHLVKGHYFFLSNRFNLTNADITFDNQRGVDPVMDVQAETRLRPSRTDLAVGGQISSSAPIEVITAHITGRSSQPLIELSSGSGWDQREILGELTYGRITGEGVTLADPVQNYLTRQINNQLSRDLSKFFNDAINQWEIQRDQGELLNGSGGVYVSVGGDVSPQVSWSLRQRLPGLDRPSTTTSALATTPYERDVEVEYRISRFIYVTTELTQRRAGTVNLTPSPGVGNADFNVNLKARWEY